MRVLFYSPLSLRFGGGFEHWVLELIARLKNYGISSTIVCTRFTAGDAYRISAYRIKDLVRKANAEYYELPYVFSLPVGSSPILNFGKLIKIIDALHNCDLIYFANAYALHDLLIYLLKRKLRKPVISGQHATLFSDSLASNFYTKTVRKTLLKKFDAIHVLNSQDRKIFEEWGLQNIYQIPIGVDVQKFKPYREKDYKIFKVLFVGRLTLQKGVDILCESIKLINKDASAKWIEFKIVGSGPLEFLIKQLTRHFHNVKFLGPVSDEELPKVYSSCDLCVMPSRRETFGIVALEAQACGLPVIGSDIPSLRSIIINGVTGTLFPKENPQALSAVIKAYFNLFRNPEKYNHIAINARENVLRHYSWEVIIPLMYDMLASVATLK